MLFCHIYGLVNFCIICMGITNSKKNQSSLSKGISEMKSIQQSPCRNCIHQPVTSWGNACSTCIHRPVMSQADACTYCMRSKVSSLYQTYLYSTYFESALRALYTLDVYGIFKKCYDDARMMSEYIKSVTFHIFFLNRFFIPGIPATGSTTSY
jgi:hypothetical protein